MNHVCNLSDGTDSASDIGRMRACYESGLIRQQRLQLNRVTHWILWVGSSPPLYGQAQPICYMDPRGGIGLMVEFGKNQFITSLEFKRRSQIVQ
jgi:hypothetical protein